MADQIVKRLDGKFHVWLRIQDGTEYIGSFDREEEAHKAWHEGQKWMNGNPPGRILLPVTEIEESPAEVMERRVTLLEEEVARLKIKVRNNNKKGKK
jgi:hypothetical protein